MAKADAEPDVSPSLLSRSTPGVVSECCNAYVSVFQLSGTRWWECTECGAVIEP